MTRDDIATLAALIVVFACGATMLSHRFYAVYQRWLASGTRFKAHHLPGALGIAAMLLALFLAASMLGWTYVIATLLGGLSISMGYVYVLRWRVEIAPVGLVLGLAALVAG
ncbi:MAG: hypothetical protein KIT25_12025 [Enhydrobacter sp.]|nr:MAG: hypothetical protein KIT25_12025 [Enhydrobacter sp.]